MKSVLPALLCAVALAACSNPEAERKAQEAAAAAEKARVELAAEAVGKQYDAAVSASDWEKARLHGAALFDQYPESDTAKRIEPGYAEVKAKGEAARELRRMQGLWTYNQTPVERGTQRSAAIYAKQRVDVDGTGAKDVQLVFRDHPQWKRSAYLVLQSSDFAKACYGTCQVKVSVDGGAPRAMAANRPDTDEAIAMFINDNRALWRIARNAKVIEIEFPVKNGSHPKATFEVGGLDGSTLPGWD